MNLAAVKEKWGPLPVWVWGVLAGSVGLLAYYFLKSRSSKRDTTGAIVPDTYSGADSGLGLVTPSGAIGSAIGTDNLETNQSWMTKAVQYLSQQGYNAADAAVWIQSYISGTPIVGAQGKNALQDAISRYGVAPDVSTVPSFVPDQPVSNGVNTSTYARFGDNLYKITSNGAQTTKTPVALDEWEAKAGITGSQWLTAEQDASIPYAN